MDFDRAIPPLGRELLAVGANPAAATFSRHPDRRVIIFAHLMSGFLAGAAGILLARTPNVAQDLDRHGLDADVVCRAGTGRYIAFRWQSVGHWHHFGAALMALITNMLVVIGVNFFWFQTFLGLILIGAYALDSNSAVLLGSSKA